MIVSRHLKIAFSLVFAGLFLSSSAQLNDGQRFCNPNPEGSYFPLSFESKILWWENTYYKESFIDSLRIDGKTYYEYEQYWEEGWSVYLNLREENGVIYQYDDSTKTDVVRYDRNFKEGHTWSFPNSRNTYELITFGGELKTPFCQYKDLMVIRAKMPYGEYDFYYSRGHGYVGAMQGGKTMSCFAPQIPKRK